MKLKAWNASLGEEMFISVLPGGSDFPADQTAPNERAPTGS